MFTVRRHELLLHARVPDVEEDEQTNKRDIENAVSKVSGAGICIKTKADLDDFSDCIVQCRAKQVYVLRNAFDFR